MTQSGLTLTRGDDRPPNPVDTNSKKAENMVSAAHNDKLTAYQFDRAQPAQVVKTGEENTVGEEQKRMSSDVGQVVQHQYILISHYCTPDSRCPVHSLLPGHIPEKLTVSNEGEEWRKREVPEVPTADGNEVCTTVISWHSYSKQYVDGADG